MFGLLKSDPKLKVLLTGEAEKSLGFHTGLGKRRVEKSTILFDPFSCDIKVLVKYLHSIIGLLYAVRSK